MSFFEALDGNVEKHICCLQSRAVLLLLYSSWVSGRRRVLYFRTAVVSLGSEFCSSETQTLCFRSLKCVHKIHSICVVGSQVVKPI